MSKLIVTGDTKDYTFFVYDLETRKLVFKKPKQIELESELVGQGRPPFRPFGISCHDNHIVIASNDKFGVFDRTTLELIKTLEVPAYINTHQIIYDGEYLFVCNSANDSIGIHNLRTNESKFLRVFPDLVITDTVPTPEDAYDLDNVHINSLYKHGDLIYFCLHKRGKKSSTFGCFNIKTSNAEMLFDAGLESHNIQIIGNCLYSLSSGTGDLIKVDLDTRKPIYYHIVDPNINFLRGMINYNGKLVIAYSNKYSYISPSKDKDENLTLDDLPKMICHLLICDPEKSTIDPLMEIPELGIITDIHLL